MYKIKEHGCAINYLVVNKPHQNIQMFHDNVMFNKMVSDTCVSVHFHILDIPYIPSPSNTSTLLSDDVTPTPNSEHINVYVLLPKH